MIHTLVLIFYLYLLLGLLFGLWFIFKGVQKVDSGMQNVKWTMRLLILPGSMALWPVLLRKYFGSKPINNSSN